MGLTELKHDTALSKAGTGAKNSGRHQTAFPFEMRSARRIVLGFRV
jgi:hypothetical protein